MYSNPSMIASGKAPVVRDGNRCTLLILSCSFCSTTTKIKRCNLSALQKYNCFGLYSKHMVSRIGRNFYFYLLKKHFTFAKCATMPTNSRYSIKAFRTLTRASLLVSEVDGILLLRETSYLVVHQAHKQRKYYKNTLLF